MQQRPPLPSAATVAAASAVVSAAALAGSEQGKYMTPRMATSAHLARVRARVRVRVRVRARARARARVRVRVRGRGRVRVRVRGRVRVRARVRVDALAVGLLGVLVRVVVRELGRLLQGVVLLARPRLHLGDMGRYGEI